MGLIKTIAAGILGLPSLLLLAVTAPVVALLSIPSLALLRFQTSDAPRNTNIDNNNNGSKDENSTAISEHAIISGGSSGIGLSIAHECVKRGMAKITILARNKSKLEKAVSELEASKKKFHTETVLSYKSVDVSDPGLLKAVAADVCGTNKKEALASTKFYLFCCAGSAVPSYFEHIPSTTFAHLAGTNQLGTIYTVQAFLPHMTRGTIVFTSSICGQLGVYGYTAYCPTKYALRGFAEALHAELADQPYLNVQLAFPPDTDTPGFAEEEKIKPQETRLISETAGLAQPEAVAAVMVQKAVHDNPAFLVYFGLEGWMVACLTAGMSPVSTVADAMSQVALNGLFRFISLFVLNDWWDMIRRCAKERMDRKEGKKRPDDTHREAEATEKSD